MDHHLHDIRQLTVFLEAEAAGRPFDRRRAHALAVLLAEHHPEIGAIMRLIGERMAESGPARVSRCCASRSPAH